ncbi:flagellar motor switch protein FliM [candidate division KSB1 bacterium]|nr:flagellar motor switch protein FliM [candidate division KSB1 bacterium]
MAEILSQKEIDALLSSVSDEDMGGDIDTDDDDDIAVEGRAANVYDFKHPNRVSKDQLRTLQTIHETFAKTFNAYLAVRLRTIVDINLISVDQLQYSEFILSISDPSCIYIFRVEELNGVAILELSPNLVLYIVDRLFGGKGSATDEARPITTIEQTIMKKIVEKAMENLSTAWQQVAPLTFILEGFESNPDVVQIAPPGETVITISLEIKIQDTSSLMNICFPYLILEDIISKLNVQHFISMSRKDVSDEQSQIIDERLKLSSLPIVAFLGRTEIAFKDLTNLKIGDVIRLKNKVDDLLEVTIGGNKKFLGRPGIKGKKKAIKIVRNVTDDDIEEHELI